MYSNKAVRCSRLLRLRICNSNHLTTIQSQRTIFAFTKHQNKANGNNIVKTKCSAIPAFKNQSGMRYISFGHVRMYALPPYTKIELPALSPTMEMGTIANWVIKEGEAFEAGDLLAEIETDKATVGFEAQDEGYIAKIIVPDGTKDIKLGTPIAIAVDNEEDIAAFKDFVLDGAAEPSATATVTSSDTSSSPQKAADNYPRHERVTLPALSPTMTTGTIAKWAVNVGDKIEEGDLLAEIETDKATMAMEAEEEGYVAKILLQEGTKDIPLGTLLCVVVANESDVSAFADYIDSEPTPKPSATPESQPTPTNQPSPTVSSPTPAATPPPAKRVGDRVFASPLAKKLAGEKGFDLAQIQGSGPNGRVRAQDVLSFEPSKAAAPTVSTPSAIPASAMGVSDQYIDIPLNKFREVSAKRLTESKQNVPHYYLTVDCQIDNLQTIRKQFNNQLKDDGVKLSVNDFVIKAASLACLKVPATNSSWQDTFIRQFHNVDVSVAVSIDDGLITPIVFGANGKGLVDISKDVGALATKAREGKLQPNEFMGGTFTISNLGMFGIKHFTAIINPPQACILAVGSARHEFILDDTSESGMSEATMMSVTLSCDHRVVDGAVGAQWLQHFKKFIENPTNMLL